jgi:nucleoside-diphosphate-sugar epimerase
MRVLVTGGHGFVGSHLVRRLLAAGDRVRCLVRSDGVPASLRDLPVELVIGDVTRAETLVRAVDGVDEVYHLAARLTALTARDMARTNVLGTRRLVEAVVRAGGVRRFVHCSSLAVAGPSVAGARTEASDGTPVTRYGRSKALAERVVAAFTDHGLAWTIVRPPVVYGPWDRGLLSMFQAVAKGFVPLLGAQPKHFSWVFGPDLADALVALGRHPATRRRTYYACHDEITTLEAFVDLASRAAGRAGRKVALPDSLIRLVASVADVVAQATGRPGMLTRDKTHELTPRAWTCSPAAARRDAGWVASTPLERGVPATVAWYRAAGWIG